ncbi:DUF2750 domain-containing protein [Arthrobacter sp. UYCu712]|uniref:DUF2750 domain-containing protein n=1 Tax=Arthrobacter sp. UYCu712 TaxID=3156340 RepID=UPI003392B418
MTTSGAHATAYFKEVIREQQVWTISDAGGFPAPYGSDGIRSMPFWSLSSRAERIISAVEAYLCQLRKSRDPSQRLANKVVARP